MNVLFYLSINAVCTDTLQRIGWTQRQRTLKTLCAAVALQFARANVQHAFVIFNLCYGLCAPYSVFYSFSSLREEQCTSLCIRNRSVLEWVLPLQFHRVLFEKLYK